MTTSPHATPLERFEVTTREILYEGIFDIEHMPLPQDRVDTTADMLRDIVKAAITLAREVGLAAIGDDVIMEIHAAVSGVASAIDYGEYLEAKVGNVVKAKARAALDAALEDGK